MKTKKEGGVPMVNMMNICIKVLGKCHVHVGTLAYLSSYSIV